jgi:cytochrome c553
MVMQFKKTFAVPLSLVVAAMLCSLSLPPQEEKAKNLKVLPKNISHEDLMKEMHHYNKALGVKCDFCHAKSKDDPKKMDFASDEKEEKETARDMMKLTSRINKKYFKSGKDENGRQIMTVTCYTCHHGEAEPAKLPEQPQQPQQPQQPHNN